MRKTALISTTAISVAATANNIFYSTTARTGVSYRVVGKVDSVNTAGAWADPTLIRGVGGNEVVQSQQILHVREEQPATINGGSSVVGNQVRVLNTVVTNTIPGASLASNQITLPLGKYQIDASAPVYTANQHRIRLVNVTDAVIVLLGSSEYAVAATTDRSLIIGVFNVTATKSFNITHFTSAAVANGLGANSGDTFIEVYTNVIIKKIG